ncbi:MAG: hypothetical protein IKE59_04615 [Erysipelotrichaceae bacterium]|nr:hypothetical protein [Erysipelotrichaceae bacterium]
MTNKTVRNYAKKMNVNLWEVAKVLGIADTTFSKHLREPLTEKAEKEIIAIIDSIAASRIQ